MAEIFEGIKINVAVRAPNHHCKKMFSVAVAIILWRTMKILCGQLKLFGVTCTILQVIAFNQLPRFTCNKDTYVNPEE